MAARTESLAPAVSFLHRLTRGEAQSADPPSARLSQPIRPAAVEFLVPAHHPIGSGLDIVDRSGQ
jgi:hypothetical protein